MNLLENNEVFECLNPLPTDEPILYLENTTEVIYMINCIFDGSYVTFRNGNIKTLIIENCAFEDVSGFMIENINNKNDIEIFIRDCLNGKDSFIEYNFNKSWRVKYGH